MDSDKEIDYLSIYQGNHFQETTNDCYKTVDIRRKCLTQTFKACHNLGKENMACNIVQERLQNINKLVDDQSLINNYANEIESLTSNINKNHCQQWKCKLKVEDFIKNITPLQCCSDNDISEEEIAVLFQEHTEHQHKNQDSNRLNQKLIVTNSFENNKKVLNKFAFEKKTVENYSQKNQIPTNKHGCEENVINPSIKRNNCGIFKTARDELEAQNVKKYGSKQSSNNQQQPMFAYGGQKKSLGARRGVQSKFIPPVRTGNNDAGSSVSKQNDSPSWDSEEIVDERLKNIDPKMIELIRSEIMDSGACISWDDIAGLEFAKTIIKEVVVWPLLRPDIFTGLRRPPKGILLFGPPGTGKTLIGKCIASQSQSTFFSISASSLTSKWIGDGEKMVRAMFAVARCHQPAVVFIDEIDSLLSQRSDTEHESSRRIKTEFLVQLDGAATGDEDRILIIGATNRPQELDEAARRRFVKRLYIPLPEKLARLEIVKRLMNNERNELSESDMLEIADLAEGYSGADMKSLCAEASLGPIRSIDITVIQNIQPDQVRAITMQDFRMALNRVRASVSPGDLEQYIIWDRTYGAGGW